MADNNQTNYLESVTKQFLYYKKLADQSIEQLQPQQLFIQPNENSNSIAIIIKHMAGNMISRWTDFLTTDGEKPWRKRDDEFENNIAATNKTLGTRLESFFRYFTIIKSR